MADRYWVGGAGTWNNVSTANWAASSGGASGASAPISTDDVTFDAASGLVSGSTVTVAGNAAANNVTITGPAVKLCTFSLTGNPTFGGIITWAGDSAINRLIFQSSSVSGTRTITCNGSHSGHTNIDFMDITIAGTAGTLTGTSIGDCGGNSGITFTTSATQTWSGTSGGNWSANAWTTRVPLPQDDVVINAAFSASQTVTLDMPRSGRSIDWTGATGTPTMAVGINTFIFGSLTLISGMGSSVSGIFTINFSGRSTYTITSAGKTFAQVITIACPSGTYTLQDALITTNNININNGSLNANGFNVTASIIAGSGTLTRSLTMGSGVWSITSTVATNVWNFANTTALTFSGASSTITISTTSANTRTFQGGGLSYGTLTYTVAGSTGALNIVGSNSFAGINFSDVTNARTLQFTAGTTTTLRNASGWNVNGTAGKLMTVQSITAATHTISCASGIVSCDYVTLVNSIATGGATFYAGANSVDGGGNSGWIFTAPPTPAAPARGSNKGQSVANLLNLQRI